MHRIDGPTAAPGGFFTEGDPVGGTPSTIVSDDWMNDVQENIIAVLTAAGITPAKGNYAQLLNAIQQVTGTGRLVGRQFLATSGTVTKTAGATRWRVRLWGGGGQGGGTQATNASQVAAGGGGSAGAYAEAWFDVTSLTTATLAIGLGGSTGAAGANGVAGGTSTLTMGASILTCPGGPGGLLGSAMSSLPNEGGTAGAFSSPPSQTGAQAFAGTPGGGATTGFVLSLASAQAGIGGSAMFGYSRPSGNAVGYGSGGPGGRSIVNTGANNGPAGAPGLCIIEEYF